jgi:hypothetical protein
MVESRFHRDRRRGRLSACSRSAVNTSPSICAVLHTYGHCCWICCQCLADRCPARCCLVYCLLLLPAADHLPLPAAAAWAAVKGLAVGNYLVVLAYQYTDIASATLLDCFTIPCVVGLSMLLLRTKYNWRCVQWMPSSALTRVCRQATGIVCCVLGLAALLMCDLLSKRSSAGPSLLSHYVAVSLSHYLDTSIHLYL